ncbi:hypothetical protein CUMW_168720 [Citrus unshiu]|uniref:Amine oxidase domain-containing protein n=1 Tax=Citrus unshiu TaxID=55188 RepID=A0A2H5PUI2_CITUN|nr:hypothetical protein CUMW_168720 [Citrus unshiu]
MGLVGSLLTPRHPPLTVPPCGFVTICVFGNVHCALPLERIRELEWQNVKWASLLGEKKKIRFYIPSLPWIQELQDVHNSSCFDASCCIYPRLELSSIWTLLVASEEPRLLVYSKNYEKNLGHTSMVNVARPCWISNLEPFNGMVHLSENGKPRGQFDVVIIAHNAEKVKMGMLEGVEAVLGLPKSSLQKPVYTRVQLWGAALPTNTPSVPCIFVPQGRASICGGWLLAASVESAALGGMALANHIADYLGSGGVHPEELAVGLYNDFQPLEGHDTGQFPDFGVHGKRGSSSISTYL